VASMARMAAVVLVALVREAGLFVAMALLEAAALKVAAAMLAAGAAARGALVAGRRLAESGAVVEMGEEPEAVAAMARAHRLHERRRRGGQARGRG